MLLKQTTGKVTMCNMDEFVCFKENVIDRDN